MTGLSSVNQGGSCFWVASGAGVLSLVWFPGFVVHKAGGRDVCNVTPGGEALEVVFEEEEKTRICRQGKKVTKKDSEASKDGFKLGRCGRSELKMDRQVANENWVLMLRGQSIRKQEAWKRWINESNKKSGRIRAD
jgi:hypothetical protein